MIPPLPESTPTAPTQLSAPARGRRCMRHSEREPVAKCLACGGSLCRECVALHEGKIYCARCLGNLLKAEEAPAAKRNPLWPVLRRGGGTLLAVVVAWWLFYGIAAVAVRIPTELHEGTIWADVMAAEGEDEFYP